MKIKDIVQEKDQAKDSKPGLIKRGLGVADKLIGPDSRLAKFIGRAQQQTQRPGPKAPRDAVPVNVKKGQAQTGKPGAKRRAAATGKRAGMIGSVQSIPDNAVFHDKQSNAVYRYDSDRKVWANPKNPRDTLSAREGMSRHNTAMKESTDSADEEKIAEGFQQPITEGGNTFKSQEGELLTQRIDLKDVIPTVEWLEGITGLDLGSTPTSKAGKDRDAGGVPVIWLGSTGRASSSGDLDFAILDEPKEKIQQKLESFLTTNNLKPANEWIKAVKQKEINFRAPIAGKPEKGFVQVDFNFYDDPDQAKWAKFYMSGTSAGFKGMHRNVLLSSLAKAHPDGIKIGANGMISRDSNEPVPNGKDPDFVAEKLLGKGHTAANLRTVEDIYAALENDPNRDAKLADFSEFLQKQGLEEPSSATPKAESLSDRQLNRIRQIVGNMP